MTTRIVLALVAFTAAVLVGAVVPLTLNATGHDRTNFVQATVADARTDAAVAQPGWTFSPSSSTAASFRRRPPVRPTSRHGARLSRCWRPRGNRVTACSS